MRSALARSCPPGPWILRCRCRSDGRANALEDQKQRCGAGSQNPSSLLFALSLSVQRATERSRELTADATRGWRLRRGTPRRRTCAAGAARGTIERHHGGALWPEPEAEIQAANGGGGSEGCLRLRLGLGLGGLQSATRPIQVPSRPHPHPHRLLRPPQRTKAPQDAKSAPRGRHGAMADAIHAGAVASPWREPEKRHGDMATIWRRYSDALTTMVLSY